MDRWVTDRPPTVAEVVDWDYCWVCQTGTVVFATGYAARVQWGKSIIAWEPPPKPYSEKEAAKQSAEVIAALWNAAKAKEMLEN
jgi:hypothetical protein